MQWESRGYVNSERETRHVPLGGPIHPIFSFLKDEVPPGEDAPGSRCTDRERWSGIGDHYNILGETLRIATMMIECPASNGIQYDIMYGERLVSMPSLLRHDLQVFTLLQSSTPYDVKEKLARQGRLKLAESISFCFIDSKDREGIDGGTQGITSPNLERYPQGVKILQGDESECFGLASTTFIRKSYLDTLVQLYDDPEKNQLQIRSLQFKLAVTIDHEVAHALNQAVDPALYRRFLEKGLFVRGKVPNNEPFYNNHQSAEWGFSWEKEVFGGYITQHPDNTNAPILISEWPSYRHRYPESYPSRGLWPACTVEYLVPTYYLNNIQNQRYWACIASAAPSTSAFKIRRAVGIRFDHEGDEINQKWSPPKDETHTSLNNRVTREQGVENRVMALVNGKPDHLLGVEIRIFGI